MKALITYWLKISLLIQLLAITANAAQETNACDIVDQLKRLKTFTDDERAAVVRTNDNNLRRIQEALIVEFDSGDTAEKCYAAYLLGDYRFPQAADLLAKNITLEDKVHPAKERGSEWFWDRFPAMEALIKIGNPSLHSVIRNLAESDDVKIRELSLIALCHIERDKDVVRIYLEKALKEEADSQKEARLVAALKILPEIKN